MKGYDDQNYPVSIEVLVTLECGTQFEDGIKGLNEGHALYLASLNWENAIIEKI